MSEMDRRELLKVGSATAASATLASSLVFFGSEEALAATGLTAADVSVSTTDGELNTLTLAPDITVSWDGQEAKVSTVEVTWKVKTNSTSETTVGQTPYSFDVSSPSKTGSIDKTLSTINLLSNNGGALSGSNFDATTDGGSSTTDVTISMDATLKDSGSNVLAQQTDILGPATYSVTVTNESSSLSSSGTAHTSGS